MAKATKARHFTDDQEVRLMTALAEMEKSLNFNTASQYSGNVEKHPDNRISFTEKHLNHLKKFPNIDPDQYVMNLRLMTRV